jgi:hypothetical protein
VIARKNLPANDLQELAAYAKADPGRMLHASPGTRSSVPMLTKDTAATMYRAQTVSSFPDRSAACRRHQTRIATPLRHRGPDRPHEAKGYLGRHYFNRTAGDAADTSLTAVGHNLRRPRLAEDGFAPDLGRPMAWPRNPSRAQISYLTDDGIEITELA